MSSMKYLRTSSAIKDSIATLFSGEQCKWVIVAFVGYAGIDQLPVGIRNLKIVCWPKPGATHPDGVRRLLAAGVEVYFCDNLHTKLYWAENKGVIIGSANLSASALSNSRQHEFAVLAEDRKFDIHQVISKLCMRVVSEEDLHALDIGHAAMPRREPDADDDESIEYTFLESVCRPFPRRWKLITWSEHRTNKSPIRDAVEEHSGGSTWVNDNDFEDGRYEPGDYVLQIKTNDDGFVERANGKWLRVDLVLSNAKTSAIVQLRALDKGAPPPFSIDSCFRRVFKEVFNNLDGKDIQHKSGAVKASFVKLIRDKLQEDA